jgi:hypothetical protein
VRGDLWAGSYTLRAIFRPLAHSKGSHTGYARQERSVSLGPFSLYFLRTGLPTPYRVNRVLSSEDHRSGGDRDAMRHDGHERRTDALKSHYQEARNAYRNDSETVVV